jgi:alanyl-tRNA synthetase
MTNRLYYDDPYSRAFEASVVRVTPRGDGRHAVWLDRSSFYPTSGGQPHDTGSLGDARVVDVIDEDDDVVHVVEGASALVAGQGVHGSVDWARRFDHMQQHTGQHVLSAAYARLLGAATVSFHLGTESSTIDLARELTAEEIASGEREANRIVWEDRPIAIRYAGAGEATAMGLRKESHRAGTLRLIEVEDFDLSACGGTHVARTGSIGVVAVSGWERFKGGHRLEFLCGQRALSRFHVLRDAASASTRLLSVLPEAIPSGIERLQGEIKEQRRAITTLQTELARHQARELADAAQPRSWGRLASAIIDGDANVLKSLASAITMQPGLLAVVVSRSQPALVIVARSSDLSVACQEIVAGLAKKFGGRGGGKPDLAQGGGLSAAPEAILAEAKRMTLP